MAAKWYRSDILYRCKDSKYSELLETLVYVCGIKRYSDIPVSDFIKRARKCVRRMSINCIYYMTNVCYVGQTDLNMFFHFNNVYSTTLPESKKAYREEKKLNKILLSLKDHVNHSRLSPYFESVFPAIETPLRHANYFNENYINKVFGEYLPDVESPCVVRSDFNIVVMYLLIHGEIELSVNTVSAYIHNAFNQFDYMFREMMALKNASDCLFITSLSESNSGDNFNY